LLQADNVSFRYQGATPLVLEDVSVTIGTGDLVGILGPNGSGKTTLLRLLSGTRVPTSGSITLDGEPIERLSRREIARRLAVVPQQVELAFEYSVLEIALMGRHPHLGLFQVEGPTDYAVARDALAATGTAHLELRPFHTLSGG
jgi:ABC-type cobalamin/Fe3+-siderophores transport system ATPase subunit